MKEYRIYIKLIYWLNFNIYTNSREYINNGSSIASMEFSNLFLALYIGYPYTIDQFQIYVISSKIVKII
jgi:hypothetical protein